MPWRTASSTGSRRKPTGFILPCQPTLAAVVPTGPQWIHELKHDGYRIVALKDGPSVRLWSRHGRDWTGELAAVAAAVRALPVERIVLDGEAVAHCGAGLPDFNGLMSQNGQAAACLYAFDLLRLEAEDLRPHPLGERRARLADLVAAAADPVLRFSEHLEAAEGPALFRHACAMGLEGIVSKRADRPYRSGRSPHWLKIKNPSYWRA
ncbi:MAG TPA: DNA ligase [Beijerinckiaceae bacterium]|jgi:bifunctional non-homologous end joining protein LigD